MGERLANRLQHYRLTDEQAARFQKARAKVGMTGQAFVQDAIMRRVVEVEEQIRLDQAKNDERAARFKGQRDAQPTGLGIDFEKMRAAREAKSPPAPVPAAVTNPPHAVSDASIERMAKHIGDAPDHAERAERTKAMADTIAALIPVKADADSVIERVKAKIPKPRFSILPFPVLGNLQ